MHRLLFAIDDKEFDATKGRSLHLVRILAAAGYKIDILTPSKVVYEKATETFKENERVHVSLANLGVLPSPDSFRDDLLKTFIRQANNLFIPETDMKMYKLSAFDDFYGFILPYTFPDIDVSPYSIILIPIISMENIPSMDSDCFYTTICFLAREMKVPLMGLQTQPQVHTAFLYAKILDYLVVKDEWEGTYLEQLGIGKEKIFLLTDETEAYCLKSVDDPFMNNFLELMDQQKIEIDKKKLCVVVLNHPKFRPQIREVLSLIGQIDVPVVVFMVKFGYSVQELTEEAVIQGVYGDVIRNMKDNIYYAGRDTLDKVFLVSDIIVSTTYWDTLSLAVKYNKTAVVYNKIFHDLDSGDGVIFMDDPKELKELMVRRYNEKKARYRCLADLVGRLCAEDR